MCICVRVHVLAGKMETCLCSCEVLCIQLNYLDFVFSCKKENTTQNIILDFPGIWQPCGSCFTLHLLNILLLIFQSLSVLLL